MAEENVPVPRGILMDKSVTDPVWTWDQMRRRFQYVRDRLYWIATIKGIPFADIDKRLENDELGWVTVQEYPDAFIYPGATTVPVLGVFAVSFGGLVRTLAYSRKHIDQYAVLEHEMLHWAAYVAFPGTDNWLHCQHGTVGDFLVKMMNDETDWWYKGVPTGHPGQLPSPRVAPAVAMLAQIHRPLAIRTDKENVCLFPASNPALPPSEAR